MKVIDKDQILQLARENIIKFPSSEDILGKNGFIYISGSILEGFGNEASDVDVFVIYEGEKDNVESFLRRQKHSSLIEKNGVYTWNFRIGAKRFDCEFWKYGTIKKNIEILNNIDINSESHIENVELNGNDLDFFHRYQYGIALFHEYNYIKILKKIHFDKLRHILALRNTAYASALLEDIQGAYLAEDRYSTYFLLKSLVNCSLNAYLAMKGETNPSDKWTYRKLNRYVQKNENIELMNQYLEIQTIGMGEKNFDEVLGASLEFSQRLLQKTQNEILYYQKKSIEMSKTY